MERVEIGNSVLYHGDCREILPSLTFDALVTDPPYGIGYQHSGNEGGNGPVSARGTSKTYTIHGDDTPFDPGHLTEIKVPMVIWGADHMRARLPDGGRFLAWDKAVGIAGYDSFTDVEFAWTNRKDSITSRNIFRYMWKGILTDKHGRCDAYGKATRYHVSEKPEPLMRWCIELLRQRAGNTICDPYMGAGSSGLAAVSLGMKYIGIEIAREHFDTACMRLERAQAQAGLFTA